MNELALFAGAGGGILGGKLLGWRTVCAVEIDDYARSVLIARQEDGSLAPFPIWDDIRTFDGRPWRGVVDIVTGGFPCQDISVAGKGAGISGERSGLWGEMSRIICEVGPRYVLVENSPVLTSRGLGRVVGDLASMGYDARWGVLGADDAGAPHRRDRIWIVAHSAQHGWGARGARGSDPSSARERELALQVLANSGSGRRGEPDGREMEFPRRTETERASYAPDSDGELIRKLSGRSSGTSRSGARELANDGKEEHVADAARIQPGREDEWTERERAGESGESIALAVADMPGRKEQRCALADGVELEAAERGGWWLAEPDVGRVAHGVADRVDRLRCLGNGQVPAVVRLAWHILST